MRWVWSSAVLLVLVLAGCGDDGGSGSASAACGPDENLVESRAWTHVIDPADAEFDRHPPTGGPHTEAAPEAGVHDEPIPEATQVTGLELGMVALNYSEDVPAADVEELESLAESHADLIVAPAVGPMDGDARVALTARDHRMLCDEVDLDAARQFIERHADGKAEVE